MDRMPFRPKPKIVDLTSERKLADKVSRLLCHLSSFPFHIIAHGIMENNSCGWQFPWLAWSGAEACSKASSVIGGEQCHRQTGTFNDFGDFSQKAGVETSLN